MEHIYYREDLIICSRGFKLCKHKKRGVTYSWFWARVELEPNCGYFKIVQSNTCQTDNLQIYNVRQNLIRFYKKQSSSISYWNVRIWSFCEAFYQTRSMLWIYIFHKKHKRQLTKVTCFARIWLLFLSHSEVWTASAFILSLILKCTFLIN